jgi:hypothetical protein
LHSPFDAERHKLMPIQHVYPIKDVLEVIKSFDFGLQRRVSFEYIMFAGVNDSPRHVNELVKILNGIRCRINLIRFHAIPDTPLTGSDDSGIENFRDALTAKGITTTIRASRGAGYLRCLWFALYKGTGNKQTGGLLSHLFKSANRNSFLVIFSAISETTIFRRRCLHFGFLGRAWLTIIFLTHQFASFNSSMACLALSSSFIVTNPKPLLLCVTLSVTILAEGNFTVLFKDFS